MNIFLVDIGATKIRFARSDGQRIITSLVHPTPSTWPVTQKLFTDVRKQLFATHKINRTVIGIPGIVSLDRRKILRIPNLPQWPIEKILPDFRRICGSAIRVENDAVLNGLGEALFGAGRGRSIVGFLTLSTGVNGIRIVNGRPDARAFPVELRHLLIRYKKKTITLGHAISGLSLERQYKLKPEFLHTPAVWNEVSRTLAEVLVNLGLIWTPDIIVIGGSVSKSISLAKLRLNVRSGWHHRFPAPRIVKGKLRELSGVYGALALSKKI